MPFLDNLILGKLGGERRRRNTEDRSLTGDGDGYSPSGAEGALPVQRRSRLLAGEELDGGTRRACGNALCGSGWTMPWKSREHPIFEGRWACSKRCLAAMVRAALLREAGDGFDEDGPERHTHRIPLGLVMLAQGWITHPQLQKALEAQRAHGTGKIGEWLVSECGMKPERVARGLGVQWNCPVLSTESFWPEAMALTLPRVFLEEYGVVPLRLAGRKLLYVAFQDSLDASASFALEQMTGLKTESGVLPEEEFIRARKILLGCEFPRHSIAAVSDRDGLARAIEETVEHEQPEASRLVRLHRYYWLRVWTKGQKDRAAGDLPTDVSGVADYLFTIGSRAARSSQEDRPQLQIAVPEWRDVVEEPVEASTEAEEALSERAAEEEIEWVAEADVEAETTVAFEAAPDTEAAEEEVSLKPETAVEVETILALEAEEVPEASVARPEAAPIAEEPRVRNYLARQDSSLSTVQRRDELAPPRQVVKPEESVNLQRFMRRGFEAEIEPIDGEYLTVELTSLESSALVFEHRPLRWARLGRLLKPKPTFPVREIESVSGQDRGV